ASSAWRLSRAVSRSAAVAWASRRAAATVLRTRPHRSTSYDMSSDRRMSPELPGLTPDDRNGWWDDSRTELGPKVVEIVGKRPARLKRTAARASRRRASASLRA